MTLPPGWTKGLTVRQINRTLEVERQADEGRFPLIRPTGKGYSQLYLGLRHPYANASGCQMLHRYVMMRHLGRKLGFEEHVHHRDGAAKDTAFLGDLVLCEALTHDHYHYGVRIACGQEIEIWEPRDARGRWTPYPSRGEVNEIFRRLEAERWGSGVGRDCTYPVG